MASTTARKTRPAAAATPKKAKTSTTPAAATNDDAGSSKKFDVASLTQQRNKYREPQHQITFERRNGATEMKVRVMLPGVAVKHVHFDVTETHLLVHTLESPINKLFLLYVFLSRSLALFGCAGC
jgi:hypothetical protein